VKKSQMSVSKWGISQALVLVAAAAATPFLGSCQTFEPLDAAGKLQYHVESLYSPWAIAGIAAYAGVLQEADAPMEWGQGAGGYGKRFGSTLAWSGIHGAMAFALDSTLHQDPRYSPSHDTGFWRRSAHALRGTILTHTDRGGETFSTWRVGSAYGAAFLSNQWYPDRVNTVRLGFIQGTVTLGFGMMSNLGVEFLPDIKRKLLRRK
jgi:hypothetical protein